MNHKTKHSVVNVLIVVFVLIMGCVIATYSAARLRAPQNESSVSTGDIKSISPTGHQAIKASVISAAPSAYKIDVKKLANMGVNEEAPTFAVYIKSSLPGKCGDFRALELPYKKPSKYEREFDLSEHEEVLQALDQYGCVVMRNIPPAG